MAVIEAKKAAKEMTTVKGDCGAAGLRLEDWQDMSSLLNESAIAEAERGGYKILFGKLGRKDMAEQSLNDAIRQALLIRHADSGASEEIRTSVAAEKLYNCFNGKEGGFVLYPQGYVALFLPASEYPNDLKTGLLQATDGGLSCLSPVRYAQTDIQRAIEQTTPQEPARPLTLAERYEAALENDWRDWLESTRRNNPKYVPAVRAEIEEQRQQRQQNIAGAEARAKKLELA